jgi:CheY-like chemotaxis protein
MSTRGSDHEIESGGAALHRLVATAVGNEEHALEVVADALGDACAPELPRENAALLEFVATHVHARLARETSEAIAAEVVADFAAAVAVIDEREIAAPEKPRALAAGHLVPFAVGQGDAGAKLPLDERQAFVMPLIDGRTTIESIAERSPLPAEETLRALIELEEAGLISVQRRRTRPASSAPESAREPEQERAHVLVIDDDADIREVLTGVLSDNGLVAHAVGNGKDALEYLATNPRPRVILLDLMMPVMDGTQFREAQLADARLASIPIIVVSAAQDAANRSRTLRAQGCVAKPIDVEHLMASMGPLVLT